MENRTLVFPIKDGKILLGMKKRGFGMGKINGFGGKLDLGESIQDAAIRELYEEVGLKASPQDLKKMAEIDFYFPHQSEPGWDQQVHVFLLETWEGEPQESEEMGFDWYDCDNLPFGEMWDDDKYWVPEVLKGRKIQAIFRFAEDNSKIEEYKINSGVFTD